MDRNVLNDIVNILCANIEKVHGVIITNGGLMLMEWINMSILIE